MQELISTAKKRNVVIRRGVYKADLVDLLEKADNELIFPFMELPTELRLKVYYFAFLQKYALRKDKESTLLYGHLELRDTFSKEVCYFYSNPSAYGNGSGPLIEHPLTRVSRFVRQESLPLFYETRRFPILKLDYGFRRFFSRLLRAAIDLSKDFLHENGPSDDKIACIRSFSFVITCVANSGVLIYWNVDISFWQENLEVQGSVVVWLVPMCTNRCGKLW